MANVSSSNTTTLYSTTQDVPITQGAPVPTGQVNESNFTTLYGQTGPALNPNGNQLINGNLLVTGSLQVDGCNITTDCTTFNLLPTTATTINFGLDATALNMGATTGTTTVNNDLAVDGNITVNADNTAVDSQITFKNSVDTGYLLYDDIAGYASFELSDRLIIAETVNASLNTVVPVLDLRAVNSGGVPQVGFGPGLSFNSEYPGVGYSTVGYINTRITDATPGAVDFNMNIGLTRNSSLPDVKLTINSEGDVSIDGNLTINMDQTVGTSSITFYDGTDAGVFSWEGDRWRLSNHQLNIDNSVTTTNVGETALILTNKCTTTPVAGFGTSIGFYTDDASNNLLYGGYIGARIQDATPGSEDYRFEFGLRTAGVAPSVAATLYNDGNIVVKENNTATATGIGGRIATNDYWHVGGYSVGGAGSNDGALEIAVANNGLEPIFVRQYTSGLNTGPVWPYGNTVLRTLTLLDTNGNTELPGSLILDGSTSGSTRFNQPATGANVTYTLPNAQGAASTVLTNDGAGNLTWALPGGGGSTFGNITVGVVTDNTISTTTGDLILDSATNNVNVTATLTVDGQIVLNQNNNINIEGRYFIDSAALVTTTTAANQVLAFYGATTIRSAKFVVQIESGTDYQIVEILAIHNGTNGFVTSYGDVRTGANLASFDADVSGGNFRLLTTPVNAATTYRVAITAIDA
jgi:hypothetical protein